MAATLVNKLSIKKVIGKIRATKEETIKENGKDVKILVVEDNPAIMRVVGVARKFEIGESDFGEYTKFVGTFQATDLRDNKDYRSGNCFLPEVATDMLRQAIIDNEGSQVEFGFDIGVIGRPELAIGYEYTVTPLIEATEADPLQMLANKINAEKPKQIAAPGEGDKKK